MIIVDDGSADETKRVAFNFVRKYSVDKVRVILLGRNYGKGEAIRKVSPIYTIHSLKTFLFDNDGSMYSLLLFITN